MKKVGEVLKEKRVEKKISLSEVSQKTKIREVYLKAIEENDFDSLPSLACAKGFIKNYAQFLGVSPLKAVAIFRRDFDKRQEIRIAPESPKELRVKFFSNPKNFWIIVLGLVTFAILVFLVFKLFSLTTLPYV